MKPLDGEALRQFQSQIDAIPELTGAGIAFIGDGRCVALRTAQHSSGLDTYVILQEDQNGTVPRPPPSIVPEAVGLGINCLGAVFSWAALLGEVVAAPMTGGASGVLAVASVGAVTATSIQCAAAIFRTSDVAFNKGSLVEWLDSQDWYAWAAGFLDGVSLAGAALSTSAAVRAALGVRRVSSRSFSERSCAGWAGKNASASQKRYSGCKPCRSRRTRSNS